MKINKTSAKVQIAERNINQTAKNLQGVVEAIVDAHYIAIQTRNKFPIPEPARKRIERDINALAYFARPDEDSRGKWLNEMGEVLKQSGVK